MWQCVTGQVIPEISKEHSASTFKDRAAQE
jgi:hypothetical protein